MRETRTEDVKRLYETYPYPYGAGNNEPDYVFAHPMRGYFYMDPLEGWKILDAGCGTGHKLVGQAITYPKARFVGLELSGASFTVARSLVEKHGLANVELRHGNILELDAEKEFDFVQSIGVVHHLEDPQRGLDNLSRATKEDGILAVWLYHPLGEFERLTQRELLLTLWRHDWKDMEQGQALMHELGLDLELNHYGPRERDANVLEGNADAFMHPIVNAYRISEALAMLRAAGNDWAAPDFVNIQGTVRLVNLGGVSDPFVASFCISESTLLTSPVLQERYRELPRLEQLGVIELTMRPRGFQILSGRGKSWKKLGARLRGNVLELGEPLAAPSRDEGGLS